MTFLFPIFLYGCSASGNCGGWTKPPTLRILFIGNSYTFVNDLPGMFSKLACSGGRGVETGMSAEGGFTLAQHAASANTLALISAQKWDIVVLQEQSEIPAMPAYRTQNMYPAIRTLVNKIRTAGAKPMLFMTWGHRDGSSVAGYQNFNAMQEQLYEGNMVIARELKIPVAPVGFAWLRGRIRPAPLNLWQDDGSHPNEGGTYLTACVFYATVFGQSPVGLTYTGSLETQNALDLQKLAADTVLNEASRWNIDRN